MVRRAWLCLGSLLFACSFACSSKTEVVPPPEPPPAGGGDVALPPELEASGFHPLATHFGYDPAHAREVYGVDLQFVNFDPAAFDDSEAGKAAVRALGRFISHNNMDVYFPFWARMVADGVVGDPRHQLNTLGLLPTPYRAQLDAVISVPTADGGEIQIPQIAALNEAYYLHDDGEGSPRAYFGLTCLSCHSGVIANQVVGGLPSKDYHSRNISKNVLQNSRLQLLRLSLDGSLEGAKQAVQQQVRMALQARGLEPAEIAVSGDELAVFKATADWGLDVARRIYNDATTQTVGAQATTFFVSSTWSFLRTNGNGYDDWLPLENGTTPDFEWMIQQAQAQAGGEAIFPLHYARPWWLGRYSGTHFWFRPTRYGVEHNSHVDLAIATDTPNFGNPHIPPFTERLAATRDLMQYIDQIQSPDYPGSIDWAKARAGLEVYNTTCARCHGALALSQGDRWEEGSRLTLTYDIQGSLRSFDEAGIGVDRRYFRLVEAIFEKLRVDKIHGNSAAAEFRPTIETLHADYSKIEAPPLIGVWASAPYLHNGSVPTLYHMLKSDARPAIWKLDPDPYAYDYEKVGVAYRALDPSEIPANKQGDDWRIYDTRLEANGMTNAGHTTGDALDEESRAAVIELLKTLTTKNVRPNPVNDPYDTHP